MDYSYKFRIYPTKSQIELIQKTFGCCRFVYNHYLDKKANIYKENKTNYSFYSCCSDLTILKKDLCWLKEVDSTALIASLRNVDMAYTNFYRRLKRREKATFPLYKSKKNNNDSYTSKNTTNTIFVTGNKIKLPKLGYVDCRISKQVIGRILSATITRNKSGKYFVSICCTGVDIKPIEKTGKVCGIDLGIKDIVVTSDGAKYPNAKCINKTERKIAKLQRNLSRKTRGSKRWEKARIKVARQYEYSANQRRDSIQKLTTDLIRRYDIICVENLDVSELIRRRRFSKYIADASLYEILRELKYKAVWYGKTISVVDRYYPSSQLCSNCGYKNASIRNLDVRKWVCPNCGGKHDRDINAAKNILIEGLRLLA